MVEQQQSLRLSDGRALEEGERAGDKRP